MMDQEAWDTATAVDGYVKAWETEPKSGIPLSSYEGQELIPGKPFSQEVLRSLFAVISSINFCACRELDVANLGATAVAQNVLKFIEKDLDYAKEHAALQQRASHWLVQGSPNSLLMTKLETTRCDAVIYSTASLDLWERTPGGGRDRLKERQVDRKTDRPAGR